MGIVCPLVPEHGTPHQWNKPPSYFPYWCPNSDHGGNGLFISQAMMAEASSMSKDLDEIIPQILSGEMTEHQAASILARRANTEASILLPTIATRVRYARAFAEIKQTRAVPPNQPNRVQSSPSKGGGGDKVPPHKFMEVMLKAGLTKKQAAEAIGRSVSRVHELTVTQGGKQHLYDTFVEAIAAYGGQAGDGNGESGGSPASD